MTKNVLTQLQTHKAIPEQHQGWLALQEEQVVLLEFSLPHRTGHSSGNSSLLASQEVLPAERLVCGAKGLPPLKKSVQFLLVSLSALLPPITIHTQ